LLDPNTIIMGCFVSWARRSLEILSTIKAYVDQHSDHACGTSSNGYYRQTPVSDVKTRS